MTDAINIEVELDGEFEKAFQSKQKVAEHWMRRDLLREEDAGCVVVECDGVVGVSFAARWGSSRGIDDRRAHANAEERRSKAGATGKAGKEGGNSKGPGKTGSYNGGISRSFRGLEPTVSGAVLEWRTCWAHSGRTYFVMEDWSTWMRRR